MKEKTITDPLAIRRRLAAYLGLGMSPDMIGTSEGLEKIARAVKDRNVFNGDLNYLGISLPAFEKMLKENGLYSQVFVTAKAPDNDFIRSFAFGAGGTDNFYGSSRSV